MSQGLFELLLPEFERTFERREEPLPRAVRINPRHVDRAILVPVRAYVEGRQHSTFFTNVFDLRDDMVFTALLSEFFQDLGKISFEVTTLLRQMINNRFGNPIGNQDSGSGRRMDQGLLKLTIV